MTSHDLPAFLEACRTIERVFPLRGSDDDLGQVRAVYFKALAPYAIAQVQAGAERWTQTGTKFPKPAEWIAAMPPREQGGGLRHMSLEEAREYRRAEVARYEGPVCACAACQQAGVTAAQPIRFVPDFDAEDQEIKAFDPLLQRTVTTGHWIHGEELKRWYAAKANFYAKFHELCAKKSMKKETKRKRFDERLEEIFKPRPKPIEPEDAGA